MPCPPHSRIARHTKPGTVNKQGAQGPSLTFTDIDELLAMADRRDSLARLAPACPECGTQQIQLLSQDVPAKWKCRMCKHPFTLEP